MRTGEFHGAGGRPLYQFGNLSGGPAGGAAALSLDSAIHRPRPAPAFGTRTSQLVAPAADLDLIVDLGSRIGSREWLRGFMTCGALCYAAWSFAPGLEPIAVASTTLPDAQWEESRSLAIAPLAFGADTGRRMAPTDAVEPLTDTPERPRVDLLATLGNGDGLARVLERAGVAAAEARHVADLFAGFTSPGEDGPEVTTSTTTTAASRGRSIRSPSARGST